MQIQRLGNGKVLGQNNKRIGYLISAMMFLSLFSGCQWLDLLQPQGRSPLQPVTMSPDSVVVEMFFVRMPLDQQDAMDSIWSEIDEQRLPVELRDSLSRNGFRAGVVSGQMPDGLAQLLGTDDKPMGTGRDGAGPIAFDDEAETVVRRRLHARAGARNEVVVSEIYDTLPVLISDEQGVSGKTYELAQGVLDLRTEACRDGAVTVSILPEIHHGKQRQRWTGSNGIFRIDPSRPRHKFEDLKLETSLEPGSMIVMACLPNRPGSVGYKFFTQEKDQRQKLLIVRLAQTQHDSLFCPPQVLDLAEISEVVEQ